MDDTSRVGAGWPQTSGSWNLNMGRYLAPRGENRKCESLGGVQGWSHRKPLHGGPGQIP